MKRTLLGLVIAVTGCATSAGDDREGPAASFAAEALVVKTPLSDGEGACPNGGVRVESGADDDRDGALDPEEVTERKSVCRRAPGAPRLVFVSSATYPAELGGGPGADATCQTLADAIPALRGKRFMALVNDDVAHSPRAALNARGFVFDGSFVRQDGVVVANDFDAMFRSGRHFIGSDDAVLLASISVTERGEHVSGHVRTQISPAGEAWWECEHALGLLLGSNLYDAGFVESITNDWFRARSEKLGCHDPARIYCFEQ